MDIFQKCYSFTAAKEVMAAGLYPYFHPLSSGQDTDVVIEGKPKIMIGSNNYLGLTSHPEVKEAAIKAVQKYGSGCSGSRFLNGTLDLHVELEDKLAKFVKKEAGLVYSTGFQTNLGTISTLVTKHDYVIADRADHASVFDACRLSFGDTVKYKHNDMDDLERILSNLDEESGKLIVIDGVFSMEGDLANLPRIVELGKKFGARVMVDDAHGIGVMGVNGRGTAEHFGVEEDVDIIMGTFSKSFASLGGFIAAEKDVIHYVKHISRELIFSASMPPAAVAATLKTLEIIQREPERRQRLWEITHKMIKSYRQMGFDIGVTETPVIPIIIGEDLDTFKFWRMLFDHGVFANPIISPAVPKGKGLIRTSYTATHTDEQLDRVLEVFACVGKKTGVLK
ncbi:MAG: pyridoxal phosphate-dependent aminotransferase family protein [candidate division Zixibacteria bacterium]|nr:pyridoxal phosphate-dependent aminotransferase family protein [candidate division Zixibacteria bacterium]